MQTFKQHTKVPTNTVSNYARCELDPLFPDLLVEYLLLDEPLFPDLLDEYVELLLLDDEQLFPDLPEDEDEQE